MDNRNCFEQGCRNPIEFGCSCSASIFSCGAHLGSHMRQRGRHNSLPLFIEVKAPEKEILREARRVLAQTQTRLVKILESRRLEQVSRLLQEIQQIDQVFARDIEAIVGKSQPVFQALDAGISLSQAPRSNWWRGRSGSPRRRTTPSAF